MASTDPDDPCWVARGLDKSQAPARSGNRAGAFREVDRVFKHSINGDHGARFLVPCIFFPNDRNGREALLVWQAGRNHCQFFPLLAAYRYAAPGLR